MLWRSKLSGFAEIVDQTDGGPVVRMEMRFDLIQQRSRGDFQSRDILPEAVAGQLLRP